MINGKGGIGYIFTPDNDIGGVDLDCCRDPKTGAVSTEWAQQLLAAFGPTYAEVSPSGTGIKLWAHGCPLVENRKKRMPGVATGGHNAPAMEAFSNRGFFTVTGNIVPGAPRTLAAAEQAAAGWALVLELLKHDDAPEGEPIYDPTGLLDAKELAFLLTGLDVRRFATEGWVPLLCACLHSTGNAPGAMEAFAEWSAGDSQFDSAREMKETRRRWLSFSRAAPSGRRYGVGTLLWRLDQEPSEHSKDIAYRLRSLLVEHEQYADIEWQNYWQDPERLEMTRTDVADALVAEGNEP
jgi:hypothetical protein